MAIQWNKVFDTFGVKCVTKTDKGKGAYVPNKEQVAAIEASGISPSEVRPAEEFNVTVLFDDEINVIGASYYNSERSVEAGRTPEPRMGHGFISSWLDEGDQVVIGNVGSQLFALKLESAPETNEFAKQEVVNHTDPKTVIARAKKAKGKPKKRTVSREEYIRDPYVAAAAILLAKGKCSMTDCKHKLFVKYDGSLYLESHHVIPLGENGDDTIANVAALCPHCHRELHSGKNRKKLRATLKMIIAARTVTAKGL